MASNDHLDDLVSSISQLTIEQTAASTTTLTSSSTSSVEKSQQVVTATTTSRTTTTTSTTVKGKTGNASFRGKNPNLLWKSFTQDQVNEHDRFIPMSKLATLKAEKAETESEENSDNNNDNKSTVGVVVAAVMELAMPPQGSAEWFKLRSGRLTGSQGAKALGFFSSKTVLTHLELKPQTFFKSGELFHYLSELNQKSPSTAAAELPMEPIKIGRVQQTFMDWGKHHENNGVITFLQAFPQFKVQETGFWSVEDAVTHLRDLIQAFPDRESLLEDEDFLNQIKTHLPPIGASPDGIILDENNVPVSILEIKCPTPFLPAYVPVADRKKNSNNGNSNDNSGGDNAGDNDDYDDDEANIEFQYMKRKPHDKVPVYYIPQIMLQMFATKLYTCYYCSFTVTGGTNILKVDFSPEYFVEMLYWFSKLNESFNSGGTGLVVEGEAAFMSQFENNPRYMAFVAKTVQIAKESTLVHHAPDSKVPSTNSKLFLD